MARGRRTISLLAVVAMLALPGVAARADSPPSGSPVPNASGKAVFFVADGMRQDLIEQYAGQGELPTMAELLKKGTSATGGGLLAFAADRGRWEHPVTGPLEGIRVVDLSQVMVSRNRV